MIRTFTPFNIINKCDELVTTGDYYFRELSETVSVHHYPDLSVTIIRDTAKDTVTVCFDERGTPREVLDLINEESTS